VDILANSDPLSPPQSTPATVEAACEGLDVLYQQLDHAREALLVASMRWIAAQGCPEGQRARGAISHHDAGYLALRKALLQAEKTYARLFFHRIPHQLAVVRGLAEGRVAPQRESWARDHHPDLVQRIAEGWDAMQMHQHGSREWERGRRKMQSAQMKLLSAWEARDRTADEEEC